jgi:cytochrome o ubiquinol oxidase subunit II
LSSHFSGDGFPGMEFKVHAVPSQQFAAWAQGARGKGKALDGNAYAALSRPSSYVKPITYGAVAPGLFDAIVANRAPAAPVQHNQPASEQGA